MRKPLSPLVKAKAPSMMDTTIANEVIDVCAAFRDMKILPQGAGKLDINGRSATLTILNAPTDGGGSSSGDTLVWRVNVGGVATNVIVTSHLE